VITIHQRHRQTDRQTTCDRNTALCTKVHRAVKMLCPYILTFYCALVSRLNERIRQWNESGRNLLDADSNKPYGCDACVKLFVKLSCVKSTRSCQVRQATIWFQFQVCFLFCFCRPSSTPRPTVSISSHLFYNYTVQFAVQTYWNCSAISMQNPSPHSFVFFAVQKTRSGLTSERNCSQRHRFVLSPVCLRIQLLSICCNWPHDCFH